MHSKQPLILIGGGGHCKACIDVIELEDKYQIRGIVDLNEKLGQKTLGYEVIATDADIEKLIKEFPNFIITLGQIKSPDKRIHLFNTLQNLGANLPKIISPLAYVSKHAKIGQGSIIMHQAIINAGATIGQNCIINTKALIEHDAIVEHHCHISTGSTLNGGVVVKMGSFVGSGAVTKEYCVIPENSFIKANSIVK